MKTTNLKGMTSAQIFERLGPAGVDARLARRLQAAICRTGRFPDALPEVSGKLLARIQQHFIAASLECVLRQVSPHDGFARYLFRGEGDGLFEAVRIPLVHVPGDEKYVVCVSSQVGCAIGCAFCATGALGFTRNLAAWEIVDQVLHIRENSDLPVRGVVFMGMGEPMLNYTNVITAAKIFSESSGLAIAAKSITISTAGVVPGIIRFTEEKRPNKLIVSLSSADPVQRETLIPAERSWPLDTLIAAVRDYHAASGERVTLAWTMISGVNCAEKDARDLSRILRGLPVQIDLIDVNDPTGRMRPPSDDERRHFRDCLTRHVGMPIAWRYSGGRDINAACGMLAGSAG